MAHKNHLKQQRQKAIHNDYKVLFKDGFRREVIIKYLRQKYFLSDISIRVKLRPFSKLEKIALSMSDQQRSSLIAQHAERKKINDFLGLDTPGAQFGLTDPKIELRSQT